MNTLAKHIKSLLLTHKQVVLPQFGTFYTEREPAHFAGDDMFVPERCAVSFTPLTCVGDELLLESFERTYHLSREEAQRRLDTEIAESGKTLACNGSLDFDTLGTFVFAGGRIEFRPCKAGFVVPAFYGLDALVFPQLPPLATETGKGASADKKNYVIRLNRKLVHYAASIAVAVLLFFAFNTPLGDIERRATMNADVTSLIMPGVTLAPVEQTPAVPVVEESGETVEETTSQDGATETGDEVSEPVADETTGVEVDTEVQEADVVGNWTVVLASDVPMRSAQQFVDALTHDGYTGVRLYQKGRMLRVVCGSFASHDEANEVARGMRTGDRRLSGAWVMQMD